MGGYGSGRRLSNPKRAVEDGLTLRIRVFKDSFEHVNGTGRTWRGTLTWSHNGRTTATVGTVVTWDEEGAGPRVVLLYTSTRGGEEPRDVRLSVETETTPAGFGGVRRWFTCPGVRGRRCGRRVGCLHLPPGSSVFACRDCHRLTYRSRQESRQYDGLFRRLGASLGVSPSDVRRVLSRW